MFLEDAGELVHSLASTLKSGKQSPEPSIASNSSARAQIFLARSRSLTGVPESQVHQPTSTGLLGTYVSHRSWRCG